MIGSTNADRQHAGAAHQRQQQRAAARKLLRGHAQHRRPEKRLADAEQRGGGKRGNRARLLIQRAEPVQADAGQHRADDQGAERRLVRHGASPHAKHEHQPGGVDEEQHAAAGSGLSCGTRSPITRGNHWSGPISMAAVIHMHTNRIRNSGRAACPHISRVETFDVARSVFGYADRQRQHR